MRFNSCSKCGSGAINLHRYDRDKQPPDLQRPDLCDSHYWKWRHDQAADEIELLRSMVEVHHTQWLNAQKIIEARDKEIQMLFEEIDELKDHLQCTLNLRTISIKFTEH